MKKLFLIASLLMTLTGMTFAQTTPKKAPTKKDGTADMRFKANKDSAAKAKMAPATGRKSRGVRTRRSASLNAEAIKT